MVFCLAGLYDVAGDGNAGNEKAEKGDHAPLGRAADIGSITFKPFLAPVQVGLPPFSCTGGFALDLKKDIDTAYELSLFIFARSSRSCISDRVRVERCFSLTF